MTIEKNPSAKPKILRKCSSLITAPDQLEKIFISWTDQFATLTQLQQDNTKLKQQVQTLQTQVEYAPGGPGFEKARDDFYDRAKNSSKS